MDNQPIPITPMVAGIALGVMWWIGVFIGGFAAGGFTPVEAADNDCINLDTYTEVRQDMIAYGECLCDPTTQYCFCYPI